MIANCFLTSEAIKLFKKKTPIGYEHFDITYQQHFNHILMFKEIMDFKVAKNKKAYSF